MENNNKPYDQVCDKAQNLKENIHDKTDRIVDKTADKVGGAFDSSKQKENYGQNSGVNDHKTEGQKPYGNQDNWKETPHDQNDYTKKQPEAGQYGKESETGNFDKANENK